MTTFVIVLLVLVIILIWRNGCCIKKKLSGVLCGCCSKCGCKNCAVCGKKQTCPACPKSEQKECKCPPCIKYKCELKEAFEDAERIGITEGVDGTTNVIPVPAGDAPAVEVQSSPNNSKQTVAVKVPPAPVCNCPSCPKAQFGAAPYTYYPIYQPLPYGVRY